MAEWLLPGDPRWRDMLLEVEHDFYHLPCYAEVMAENDDGVPRAYYDVRSGGAILIPLLLRKIPSTDDDMPWLDAVSPYGYASPVYHDGVTEEELKQAFADYIEAGAKAGLVTTFIRLHPLLSKKMTSEKVAMAISGNINSALNTSGATVSIDLTQSEGELDQQLRSNHKRNIKSLCAAGFTTSVDNWDDYPLFRHLYSQTMQRVNATAYYQFGETYFHRLRDCLGSALHLCTVMANTGDVACGGLFTKVGGIVQYHLGATADDYSNCAPSKLMFYAVRKWAKSEGARILHLGGGLGGKRDTLFEFKRGFATHVHPFHTVKIIHNDPIYRQITGQWMKKAMGGIQQRDDYFPIYRRSHVV